MGYTHPPIGSPQARPVGSSLNKEEKRCLKNFAVEEAKACIMRNSI
jgi:hypothetical protein